MITQVENQNVVAIPQSLANEHGIKPGSRLDWQPTDKLDVLTVKVLPDYAALASSLMGAGRKHLKPESDPVADLIRERDVEDADRQASL